MLAIYQALVWILRPIFFLFETFTEKGKKYAFDISNTFSALETFKNSLSPEQKLIWFHSASVGEMDQANAIIHAFRNSSKKTQARYVFLQTYFSTSVSEKQKKMSQADLVLRMPLDIPRNYDPFFAIPNLSAIVFVAWDVWPNLVLRAKKNSIKTFLVCASGTGGLKNPFYIPILRKLDGVFTIDETGVHNFQKRGLEEFRPRLVSCGDSRFDSVMEKIELGKAPEEFLEWKKFLAKGNSGKGNSKMAKVGKSKNSNRVLFASTYSICEEYLLQFFQISLEREGLTKFLAHKSSFWVFPHKLETNRMELFKKRLDELQVSCFLFSEVLKILKATPSKNETLKSSRSKHFHGPNSEHKSLESIFQKTHVILFDQMGILAFAYELAGFVYVGGALEHRVHNTIEPAYFGNSIFTGPKISASLEALEFQKRGFLKTVATKEEFGKVLEDYFENSDAFLQKRKTISQFVQSMRGASDRIRKALETEIAVQNSKSN